MPVSVQFKQTGSGDDGIKISIATHHWRKFPFVNKRGSHRNARTDTQCADFPVHFCFDLLPYAPFALDFNHASGFPGLDKKVNLNSLPLPFVNNTLGLKSKNCDFKPEWTHHSARHNGATAMLT